MECRICHQDKDINELFCISSDRYANSICEKLGCTVICNECNANKSIMEKLGARAGIII